MLSHHWVNVSYLLGRGLGMSCVYWQKKVCFIELSVIYYLSSFIRSASHNMPTPQISSQINGENNLSMINESHTYPSEDAPVFTITVCHNVSFDVYLYTVLQGMWRGEDPLMAQWWPNSNFVKTCFYYNLKSIYKSIKSALAGLGYTVCLWSCRLTAFGLKLLHYLLHYSTVSSLPLYLLVTHIRTQIIHINKVSPDVTKSSMPPIKGKKAWFDLFLFFT